MKRFLIGVALFSLCSPLHAQEGRAYALQALATSAATPRLCPTLRVNFQITTAALIAADIDPKSQAAKDQAKGYASKLEERKATMGQDAFCAMLLTAWGPEGAIIPGLLAKP